MAFRKIPNSNSKTKKNESELLISLLLFRHGFTARFARVAKIAEELFFNFLLSPAKKQRDAGEGRKLKIQAHRATEPAFYYQSVSHK